MPAKSAAGPNLTRRLININGSGGALVAVLATGPIRAWRFVESLVKVDGTANTPQGFDVYIPNDGTAAPFTTKFQRPAPSTANDPADFPFFENWNRCAEHGAEGEVFGGAGNAQPSSIGATSATQLCLVRSSTATASTIEIVEYF